MGFGIKRDKYDAATSDLVRYRDDYTCQRCYTRYAPPSRGLQAAHYKSRAHKGTRYDPENLDALCTYCHTYFGINKDEHRAWKVRRIGEQRVLRLEYIARKPAKWTRTDMALLYEELKRERDRYKAEYIARAGRPKENPRDHANHEQQAIPGIQ